jgi:hypothetical protein
LGAVVGGGRGLEWSARSECGRSVDRTRWLTGGPNGFGIFLKLSKLTQNLKLKMDALHCSKNSEILHAARTGHYEQLSQLCPHTNINRCRVKIPGTDSQFDFFCEFLKGFNPFGKI